MTLSADDGDRARAAIGIAVPGYVVGESLGIGGFGEVFAARHAVIGREVAIKVLHAASSADDTAMARFVAEARAVNQISHPNIVEVYDFGTLADGRQYCVMERVRGETLRDVLRRRTRLPLAEALPILRGIAEAVDAAHAAGIAHRDLKPDNVFVGEAGAVKLIDFGLAKLTRDDPDSVPVTRTGVIFGTPLYMSPEQCRGKATDLRTDCYSFGVLAYHVLVGEPPWTGDALELALHHLNDTPVAPSKRCGELDARVDAIVLALLAKVPRLRPTPLVAAVAAMTGGALPRRRGRIALALALAGVAIAVGVWVASRTRSSTEPSWSAMPIGWPNRDTATAFALTSDGATAIFVRPDHSVWQRRLDAADPVPLPLEDPATIISVTGTIEGHYVVSRKLPDGASIWIEQLSPRRRDRVASGEHGTLGRDGRLAFIRGGEVYTRNLATQEERLVASVGGKIRTVAWSADGRRLAWTRSVPDNDPRAEVLDTVDGAVRQIPNVLLKFAVGIMPLAFDGASTLVYCDSQRRLQRLDLETGHETTLAQLHANTGACAVSTSAGGEHIVVATALFEASVGVMSTQAPERGWRRIAGGGIEDFTVDGALVIAAWSSPAPPNHRTRYMRSDPQMPAAAVHALDGSTPTPLSACPGALRALRRGPEILYNVIALDGNAIKMQLVRPTGCATVESWRLPDLPNWQFLRCGGDVCATVRAESDQLVVAVMRHGQAEAQELARIPRAPSQAWPDLAVAADGRQLAITMGVLDEVAVVDTTTGVVRTLHVGGWPRAADLINRAASVTWAAEGNTLYVSGGAGNGPSISVITRLSVDDGSHAVVWSQPAPNVGLWARTSPDGAWLAANLLDVTVAVQRFDRD